MLRSLHIKNFKAWSDTGQIKLAPLTIIFGANSAGKSSLGHLLVALKQTALSADRKRALHLGDDNSLIDLGTFRECIYMHDLHRTLGFELGWRLADKLEVRDPITKHRATGDTMSLQVALRSHDKSEQPTVDELTYRLYQGEKQELSATYKSIDGKHSLETSSNFKLVRNTGRAWPLERPDKFYRISDQSRARFQNADFLADFALEFEAVLNRLYFLGPLRDHPRRMYQWSGDRPESVGMKGEFAVAAILAASAEKREINRGSGERLSFFGPFIAKWLKDLGMIDSFSVKSLSEGRKEYEVLVKTSASSSEVKIADVGFGISQVLPALVQAFYCPPNSTVWMEQPEIHLHPQVQAGLADVFISAIRARENGKPRNVQLIIESHSEHLLQRVQRRIAEETISSSDVAIYFCSRNKEGAAIQSLETDTFGDIKNWPENFFGDEMADVAGRTMAAAKRKRRLADK